MAWRALFWRQWVAANALAELLGLGAVAALGYTLAARLGEPRGALQVIGVALLFVALGAVEGLVVGWAQARVLRRRLPQLHGWVGASVLGAVAAWALGMAPSTVANLLAPAAAGAPPALGMAARLGLAAGLGLLAGPVLAAFQWRRLREQPLRHAAGWWLPANGLAWAAGMPLVFAGVHLGAVADSAAAALLGVGAALAAAGALVGAIHGAFLLWLLPDAALRDAAA